MAPTTSTTNTVEVRFQLKLLIDTESERVLCAEANNDFVDFLCTLISLPLGAITKLISSINGHNDMVGSVGNLYKSIENLSDDYLKQPLLKRDILLNPKPAVDSYISPLLSSNAGLSKKVVEVFICGVGKQCKYVAADRQDSCPACYNKMSSEFHSSKSEVVFPDQVEGYVQGVVKYIVMDDLEVKPLTMMSTLNMFSKFYVTGLLEEKMVSVGIDEGLKLLKASLDTKTVLTDVFLKKNEDKVFSGTK